MVLSELHFTHTHQTHPIIFKYIKIKKYLFFLKNIFNINTLKQYKN